MTTTITIVLDSGTSWTVPSAWSTATNKIIYAIGGGQAGTQGTFNGPGSGGQGGAGGDCAWLTSPSISAADVLSIQIGVGGVVSGSGGQAGTDTWLKNAGGTKIVQAKGGASGSSNIGTGSNVGGAGGIVTSAYASGVNFPSTAGYSGAGGGGAASPNNPGGAGGDTSYAVGGVGGTGGGASDSIYAAPGQVWLATYSSSKLGYGGGHTAGTTAGPNGFNNPFGTLDGHNGGGGGGADGGFTLTPPTPDQSAQGGTSGPATYFNWTDSVSGLIAGPGGGGGGGAAGYRYTGAASHDYLYNPGYGGAGGLYGGGGGGSGGIPRVADPVFTLPYAWTAWSGVLGTPGNGANGVIVVQYDITDFAHGSAGQAVRIWGQFRTGTVR